MKAKPDSVLPPPGVAQAATVQSRVIGILGIAALLALLYFGREVLIPITLAVMLSLLVAPMIHGLRQIGFGQTGAVWVSVLALVLGLSAIATVIGSQLIHMGASLPQYESTVRSKLATLDRMTLGKLDILTNPVGRVIDQVAEESRGAPGAASATAAASPPPTRPLQVELHQPPPGPLQLLSRIVASMWGPFASAGIVIVVLVFVLLEQESLRDRFIRLAGAGDLRATTIAVNDAGERLSRFFAYQFAVNFSVGAVIWAGLALMGHSQALLWATVAALLRFVPYVGVWIAAACATLFAAAVEPGWSLCLMTLALFVAVELVASQFVEPFLYGHTTGLSPLSVVVAAIFWSWIWGPVGLVLSTPLTLCLVVAGRYVKALNSLEILFGEMPALTLPQNFYQRTLSGDAASVIGRARAFMKTRSFAAYCDTVMMPALHLGRLDYSMGLITKAERAKFRDAVAEVVEALSSPRRPWKKRQRLSLLADVSLGRQLRDRREQLSQQQGSLEVEAGSLVLCVGVGALFDELAAELLVRVLVAAGIRSRHLLAEDLADASLRAAAQNVSAVCFVSLDPAKEREHIEAMARDVRLQAPCAKSIALALEGPFEDCAMAGQQFSGIDLTARSYEETMKSCLSAVQS